MRKIISIFICIQIALFPAFVFAGNVGGWTLGGGVAQGASVVYEGTKKVVIDGVDYIKKGTAKITPTAANVAKTLGKGVAGVAVSVAVEQILGSVDWVLDPANNQIKYNTPSDDPTNPTNPNQYSPASWGAGVWYGSPSAACNASLAALKKGTTYYDSSTVTTVGTSCHFNINGNTTDHKYGLQVRPNPAYDPSAEQEQKTLPLETIAQKVISNAESGDTNAKVATTAAAADIVAEAEKDNTKARPIAQQLEASAQTKPVDEAAAEKANEATGEAKPNTANPEATDLSLEFPVFCGWAPLVCEASQVVISFPTTITEIWTAVKEWANDEPDLQQEEQDLPIDETPLDRDPSSFDTSYVTFGAQCPVFDSYEVSVGPISKSLSMDLTPLCQFAEKVRPAILGMSYLTAAGIVVAAIRET